MIIIENKISTAEVLKMAHNLFGNMVKAVVDIEMEIIALDAEMHADEEAALLENGSRQENLWGINIYPELDRNDPDFIEFDSMINLRPSQNNRSRGVEDDGIRKKIVSVVEKLII